VVDDVWQTKDTPAQSLDVYEVREDGTHGLRLVLDQPWIEQVRSEEREVAARIVEERAREYEAEGEDALGLVLRTLALRIRNY
jgi:hypothetical protein